MKLIYKGKFDGNPDSIPHGEHQPGAVKFKEASKHIIYGVRLHP